MNISKQLKRKYNASDTLFVISSFPEKGGEVAIENAVSRYSYLLLNSFPQNKKIVVFSEKRTKKSLPYELTSNILVVPTYSLGSPLLSVQLIRALTQFNEATDLMVQFEFSIFGGKIALPGLVAALSAARARGMVISFMFHQVVRDLGQLSGHLGIAQNGIRKYILNTGLNTFYKTIGALSNTIIVHDSVLKESLSGIIPLNKIVVIPHGCGDTTYLSPRLRTAVRRNLELKPKDLVVLAYGYLSWYKGTDWIVKTIGEMAIKYPERRIKLLLAGTQSPTLRGTAAYKKYKRELSALIKKYADTIIVTGFVPEDDVPGIFAAADVCVFPYRTKMSASGALSIAWQYGKRILVSESFSKNYDESDARAVLEGYDVSIGQITFQMEQTLFEQTVFELFDRPGAGYKVARASRAIAQARSWKQVATSYNSVCTSSDVLVPNPAYSYAQTP